MNCTNTGSFPLNMKKKKKKAEFNITWIRPTIKLLGTQANHTGRFSKESGYFSDLSTAPLLLSFAIFPAVKAAIPH